MRKWSIALLALLVAICFFSTSLAEAVPAARAYETPVDGTIRVLLQSLGQRTALGMTLDGAYSIDGDHTLQFDQGTKVSLGLSGESILLRTGGITINMGKRFTLTRHLSADGEAGGAYIHESEKDTLYCGDITVDVSGGSLRVIVTIHIEDYLYGVVPYEMSDSFPLEALKAQAVAARTYAMQHKARNTAKDYDVVDTTNDQVYKGLDTRYEQAIKAVDETRGVVGMVDGAYAECFYSASNGGQTALASDVWGKGEFTYLDIREDPYDLENPESVVKSANVPKEASRISEPLYGLLVAQAGQMLVKSGVLGEGEAVGLAELTSVEAVNPIYSGDSRQYGTIRFTVKASIRRFVENEEGEEKTLGEVETVDEPLTIDLSYYDQVRQALNIRINTSKYDLVEVTENDDSFTLTARRYGHGVGLSQRGAQWMAGTYGMNYLEILNFYYPGLELVEITWIERELTYAEALPESLGKVSARPTPAPTPAPLPALEAGEYYAVVVVEGLDATLNVREGPSKDDTILGVVRNGSRLIIVEELDDGWARMKTAELEGYVSMEFVAKEVAGPTAAPQAGGTETPATESGQETKAPDVFKF